MKNKWLKLVLAASLALNLAFAAAWIFEPFSPPRPKKGGDIKLDGGLNLREDQEKDIHSVIRDFRLRKVQFKKDILGKRMDIIEELGNPDFNLESIKEKTRELNKLEDQLNLDFVDTLVDIDGILDSKQRLDFLYTLSRNWFFIQRGNRGGHREK